MFKPRLSFALLNLAVIFALLGLEWYETHGGPVVVPPRDIFLVIALVWPVASLFYGRFGCRSHRSQA